MEFSDSKNNGSIWENLDWEFVSSLDYKKMEKRILSGIRNAQNDFFLIAGALKSATFKNPNLKKLVIQKALEGVRFTFLTGRILINDVPDLLEPDHIASLIGEMERDERLCRNLNYFVYKNRRPLLHFIGYDNKEVAVENLHKENDPEREVVDIRTPDVVEAMHNMLHHTLKWNNVNSVDHTTSLPPQESHDLIPNDEFVKNWEFLYEKYPDIFGNVHNMRFFFGTYKVCTAEQYDIYQDHFPYEDLDEQEYLIAKDNPEKWIKEHLQEPIDYYRPLQITDKDFEKQWQLFLSKEEEIFKQAEKQMQERGLTKPITLAIHDGRIVELEKSYEELYNKTDEHRYRGEVLVRIPYE